MKLKDIGSNQTEIIFNDGTHVLFSYETPVAVSTVDGMFVTEKKFSRTTSKHINKWCKGISYKHSVPQDLIEGLISGVSARGKFVLNTKSSGE